MGRSGSRDVTSLGKNLRQSLKQLARKTPVDQLVRRGVKQVNVVGLDHIVSLIEEAVHRSLRNKLMGVERVQVAGAAREEFLRLMASHEKLERSHDETVRQKVRAEEEIDELRLQINEQGNLLREKLEEAEQGLRAVHEGENSDIVEKINEIFMELSKEPGAEIPELRNRVLELVMDIVESERQVATKARQVAHDREVDLLQRRISKLKHNLVETENQFVGGEAGDDGISSIYREVQGLNAGDGQFARKRELMTTIFQANLELQRSISASESGDRALG